MVRVRRPLIILLMAAIAVGGQGRVVVVHVAVVTRHSDTRTGQREGRVVVIEVGIGPRSRAVADVAGGREADLGVIRVIGVVVVGLVAANANRVVVGQLLIAIHVTLLARHGQVESSQCPAGGGVVKGAAAPIRGGVALIAGGRESSLNVVGAGGAVVIVQVTSYTRAAGQFVVVIHVALRALHGRVEAS